METISTGRASVVELNPHRPLPVGQVSNPGLGHRRRADRLPAASLRLLHRHVKSLFTDSERTRVTPPRPPFEVIFLASQNTSRGLMMAPDSESANAVLISAKE
jgi:hypothetical protein